MPPGAGAGSTVAWLGRAARRRGEIGAVALAGLAWVTLAVVHSSAHEAGATLPQQVVAGSLSWAVMVVAMMTPAALPAVRHVTSNSFRWRRGRAVTAFLAAYLGVWAAFGVAVVTALALAFPAGAGAPVVVAVMLAAAAAWHVTPQRRRLLGGCRRAVPLPPRGWRAGVACVHFGVRHGANCVGACWALMLPMAVLRTGHLAWAAALAAVVVTERLLRSGPRLRAPAATGLAASAALVLVVA